MSNQDDFFFSPELEKRLIESITHRTEEEYKKLYMGEWNVNSQHTASQVDRLRYDLDNKRHECHELKQELLVIKLEATSEQLLRQQHEGLKALWDEYQTMLALLKDY